MIIDTIDNLHRYASLCPLLRDVVDYLSAHPLESLPEGKYEVRGADVWVNVQTCPPRTLEEAPLEVHHAMMDIQIPLDGEEVHGFRPLTEDELCAATYDSQADISFPSLPPHTYVSLRPGQFVIYLPGEGHAPAITHSPLKKAVFKVKYQTPL